MERIFVKQNNKDRKNCNNVSNHACRDRNHSGLVIQRYYLSQIEMDINEIYKAVSKDTLVGLDRSLKISITKTY